MNIAVKFIYFMSGLVVGSFIPQITEKVVDHFWPEPEDQIGKGPRGGHEDELVSIPKDAFRRGR